MYYTPIMAIFAWTALWIISARDVQRVFSTRIEIKTIIFITCNLIIYFLYHILLFSYSVNRVVVRAWNCNYRSLSVCSKTKPAVWHYLNHSVGGFYTKINSTQYNRAKLVLFIILGLFIIFILPWLIIIARLPFS